MARVVVSPSAEYDLQEIIRDLQVGAGLQVAASFLSAFQALFARLAAFPASGVLRPKLGQQIRAAVVSPYVVFYRYEPEGNHVSIIRLLHGRRDVTTRLLGAGKPRRQPP